MSFAGLTVMIKSPGFAASVLFIGTLFFISSDSVLALKEIGKRKQLPEQYIFGSYIVSQLFIVLGSILRQG